jgi:hypothetical protein
MRTPASMGIHAPARKLGAQAPPSRGAGQAELWAAARRALSAGRHVIGVVPVPAARSTLHVTWALAEALAALTPGSIAIVDADGSELYGATRDTAEPQVFARWLAPRIALVGPERAPPIGQSARTLGRLVRYACSRASATVVDLAGLEQRGELASAFITCDAVVVAAEAGRANERELRDTADLIGEPLLLGVVLTR